MRKYIALVLALVFTVSFCSCDSQPAQEARFLEEGDVKSVSVTAFPHDYEYSFSGDDAEAVVDYLSNLKLIADFKEEPDGYGGMTWIISLEYENGDIVTVHHFGNMFIKTEDGPWYKMDYDEASRFKALLDELNN